MPMLRRAHIAVLLLLTLVLAPVTTAFCGVHCIGLVLSHVSQKQSAHPKCVARSACCPSSRRAICPASPAADDAPAFLKRVHTSAGDDGAQIAADLLSNHVSRRIDARRRLDSAPPGRVSGLASAPLRI